MNGKIRTCANTTCPKSKGVVCPDDDRPVHCEGLTVKRWAEICSAQRYAAGLSEFQCRPGQCDFKAGLITIVTREQVGKLMGALVHDACDWHTKLLMPNTAETLRFTAPTAPGDYPYLCTFPGHWVIMRGMMHVR